MKRVLIIEDEQALARFLELELIHEGFEVAVSHNGRDGLDKALNEEWSLILLDLMLPLLSGVEAARRCADARIADHHDHGKGQRAGPRQRIGQRRG